jgi:hypothetical protein
VFARAALLPLLGAACATVAFAQTPASPSAIPAGSNLLNPNVSVIGWFEGEAGDQNNEEGSQAFALREAELGFQANVDPYSRADFFIAVSPEEGVDLEEGYLTLVSLPAGFGAKLGKFRSNFGKFNRTHPPETPFADRPLAAERFLGEEGLASMGASISWLAPLPFYLNLDAEVTNTPEAQDAPAFAAYRGKDLLYLGRLSTFANLGESANLSFGVSVADGANGSAQADTTSPLEALRSTIYGGDVTFRWKNPRRAIYRSLLAQMEWMERSAESLGVPDVKRSGGFAMAEYQFARRWRLGGRYDWSRSLDKTVTGTATGALAYLTFAPSEFSLVSLQARTQELEDGSTESRYFLKTTFNIGPHGAHPF